MFFSYRSANSHDNFIGVQLATVSYFHHNNQPLAPFCVSGEDCAYYRWRSVTYTLHRQFNIMRIVILPPNDNQVFNTSGDKQLTILYEPKVAGAKEWALVCSQ